jgi:hypothetical protein
MLEKTHVREKRKLARREAVLCAVSARSARAGAMDVLGPSAAESSFDTPMVPLYKAFTLVNKNKN